MLAEMVLASLRRHIRRLNTLALQRLLHVASVQIGL